MFTTWQQIKEWLCDNQFDRWIFSRMRQGDGDKFVKTIDSEFYAGDEADKIAMTKKYLESNGGHFYGYGYRKASSQSAPVLCEVTINDYTQLPPAGVGQSAGVGEAQLRETIRKEMQAEWDKREYERLRKDLDKERKEFEAEKTSALGLLTNYLAPIGKALLQKRVAGIDADAPVEAEPVKPIVATQEPEKPADEPNDTEQSPFTDDEADKLFELMARFKKVEPEYLKLIEAVVTMAESGDNTYKMARMGLLGA